MIGEQDFRRTLASRLKAARDSRDLTQRQLSEMAGIAEKYLSRIEMGIAMPSVFVMHRLAVSLELTLDDLVPVTAEGPARRASLRSLDSSLAELENSSPEAIAQAARVLAALVSKE